MNASSIDIKDILESVSSLGMVFGETLFIAEEPSKPNNCATIFDTMGAKPSLTLDKKSIYNPSVQIRVRNNAYLVGWILIDLISSTLHARAQETWNGTLYSVISISSGPAFLHRDANDRFIFIVNLYIQRRKNE